MKSGHLPTLPDSSTKCTERGLSVILASSAKGEEVERYLDLLDAPGAIKGHTSSADVEATKPEPDLVQAATREVRRSRSVDDRGFDLGHRSVQESRDRVSRGSDWRILQGRVESRRRCRDTADADRSFVTPAPGGFCVVHRCAGTPGGKTEESERTLNGRNIDS